MENKRRTAGKNKSDLGPPRRTTKEVENEKEEKKKEVEKEKDLID